MLYFRNRNILLEVDDPIGGAGGGTKTVVDYTSLQGAQLEQDLAQLTAAKEKLVAARAKAVAAGGGASNLVGSAIDGKLSTFDEGNFNLAIAEIQKIIDSMKVIGQSYQNAHENLANDIANINIETLANDGTTGGSGSTQ